MRASLDTLKFAAYLLVALVPALLLHEWAHSIVSVRLGDRSPQLYGRLRFLAIRNPHFFDPFGTAILPGLLLLANAAGLFMPVMAYAKPMPRNPNVLRRPVRDTNVIALAGPLANLALAAVAGVLLRLVGLSDGGVGELSLLLYAVLLVNVTFFVFYLMPIPGLDGSVILGQYLHGRAGEVYANMAQYLPLWMLLVFFILGGIFLRFVEALSGAICQVVAGFPC